MPPADCWASRKDAQSNLRPFDAGVVQAGDTVLGTLPVNLIAEVCKRGGRYFHLTLELPAEARGKELTAEDMRHFGARLEEFSAKAAA